LLKLFLHSLAEPVAFEVFERIPSTPSKAIALPSCWATEGQALTVRRNPCGAIKFVENVMAAPAFQSRPRPRVPAGDHTPSLRPIGYPPTISVIK
jgi:hypothetical protein